MTDPRLEALREAGAHLYDPARFHYLEVLARRMRDQPEAVQRLLAQKLEAAIARYPKNASHPRPTCDEHRRVQRESALARLNQTLGTDRRSGTQDDPLAMESPPLPPLKSVGQFSKVWSHIAAEQQVVQSLHKVPENAGPLNAHKLMLRSLSLMRSLSPDYLRHFMAQMDTLLWLEQANQRSAPPAARAVRKTRIKP